MFEGVPVGEPVSQVSWVGVCVWAGGVGFGLVSRGVVCLHLRVPPLAGHMVMRPAGRGWGGSECTGCPTGRG